MVSCQTSDQKQHSRQRLAVAGGRAELRRVQTGLGCSASSGGLLNGGTVLVTVQRQPEWNSGDTRKVVMSLASTLKCLQSAAQSISGTHKQLLKHHSIVDDLRLCSCCRMEHPTATKAQYLTRCNLCIAKPFWNAAGMNPMSCL